ncbi:dephospho-CoA kinase [Natribacillus halophilus]|uniref:Dephospho-CoA kinase n=1 Tax=Natribacillus halophilus TaxID=549003 RepID=A0A1G8RZH3_9BACI|nr:dephospho-CoA kinase [Natribacillus halophilus]SDJ21935.1 dephospho-CoA kinase [Natribacillus halophilus]
MIIGLTGGIASGKSLLADDMRSRGLPIIDADAIAREVVEPGKPVYEKIKAFFGARVFHEDGTLDRKALGRIIFADEEKRQWLNSTMHPAISEEMMAKKDALFEQGHHTLVFDIPLLIENNRMNTVDRVLLAYVDEDVQLKRLMERDGSSEEEALDRIRSQMPLKEKKDYADAIVDNNGSRDESSEQLAYILAEWNIDPRKS